MPTQVGVALPKFYLWTKVFEDEKMIDQGAVRVAAFTKKGFEITSFHSISSIRNNPESILAVFPRQVCEKILAMVDAKD